MQSGTQTSDTHVCSLAAETCPSCGYVGTRDEFEGFETRDNGPNVFFVRCLKCEEPHPDQSNHDARDCDPCIEAGWYE